MNSFFYVLFINCCLILGSLSMNAKNYGESQQLLVLDSYTVPIDIKGAKIGTFIAPNDESVTLIQDGSGFFEIEETGDLVLKKNKSITRSSPISFTITVKYGNETKTFEIVKDEFIKNKVVAHRGGWKHSDTSQNSLGSLRHAIEIGCEGSELDVWLTKDKRVALNHDADLDGKIIEKTTLSELQKIELKNQEAVPTLEDYISLIKTQNKTRLVIELKSNKSNKNILELTDSVVNIVHRMNAQAWVDYISFDYRGLKLIREMDATAHIAFLEPTVDLDLQKLDGMNGIDYHYSHFDKIERLHEKCLFLGLTMNAWTVNDEVWMKRFLEMNIDFITTDEPEMLLNLLKAE